MTRLFQPSSLPRYQVRLQCALEYTRRNMHLVECIEGCFVLSLAKIRYASIKMFFPLCRSHVATPATYISRYKSVGCINTGKTDYRSSDDGVARRVYDFVHKACEGDYS